MPQLLFTIFGATKQTIVNNPLVTTGDHPKIKQCCRQFPLGLALLALTCGNCLRHCQQMALSGGQVGG
ncbi:hypothetical protein GYMLUDRAFT_383968 [Collybiopsis luxurians FD-317 M1]|nr:hypothetical protein GYMLUDRAFT_383968 [Collybiopsis luxurians FD-317 M1]